MRYLAGLMALIAVVSACSATPSTSGPPRPASRQTPSRGCGATVIAKGDPPSWTASARPPRTRYVISAQGNAAGFLFADPLRAGTDPNLPTKILWVVRQPRDDHALTVTAHPLNTDTPLVTATFAADSSPGEIYPSGVSVPTAGCWHFTLRWNGNTATIDLPYS
jgi:hypothetical protein